MKKAIIWLLAITVILAALLWGPIMSNVEQARYDVFETHGAIEIRDYAPMIVAEVSVTGDREKAISDGFRLIADYIFGNNISSQEVAMTAPVIQQPSEKIAMTAPVIQQGDKGLWVVRFVMPSAYTMQTLPKPNNSEVVLKQIAGKRYAVIRFSGLARTKSLEAHTNELEAFILENNLQTVSKPTYAFFNPPWTLPLLRRNEVMIEINR
ncbi:MAG: heme-binding protein [Gammaproteobacteria bacterium]|nr:heme-binding protein [Gammaproteobacteria bacterium]